MIETPRCVDCDEPVETTHPLSMFEIAGFVKARKRGVNAPKWKYMTGRWLCANCAVKREHGVAPTQEVLL